MKIAGGQGRVYQSKRMVIIIIVRDKVAAQGSFRTAKNQGGVTYTDVRLFFSGTRVFELTGNKQNQQQAPDCKKPTGSTTGKVETS